MRSFALLLVCCLSSFLWQATSAWRNEAVDVESTLRDAIEIDFSIYNTQDEFDISILSEDGFSICEGRISRADSTSQVRCNPIDPELLREGDNVFFVTIVSARRKEIYSQKTIHFHYRGGSEAHVLGYNPLRIAQRCWSAVRERASHALARLRERATLRPARERERLAHTQPQAQSQTHSQARPQAVPAAGDEAKAKPSHSSAAKTEREKKHDTASPKDTTRPISTTSSSFSLSSVWKHFGGRLPSATPLQAPSTAPTERERERQREPQLVTVAPSSAPHKGVAALLFATHRLLTLREFVRSSVVRMAGTVFVLALAALLSTLKRGGDAALSTVAVAAPSSSGGDDPSPPRPSFPRPSFPLSFSAPLSPSIHSPAVAPHIGDQKRSNNASSSSIPEVSSVKPSQKEWRTTRPLTVLLDKNKKQKNDGDRLRRISLVLGGAALLIASQVSRSLSSSSFSSPVSKGGSFFAIYPSGSGEMTLTEIPADNSNEGEGEEEDEGAEETSSMFMLPSIDTNKLGRRVLMSAVALAAQSLVAVVSKRGIFDLSAVSTLSQAIKPMF